MSHVWVHPLTWPAVLSGWWSRVLIPHTPRALLQLLGEIARGSWGLVRMGENGQETIAAFLDASTEPVGDVLPNFLIGTEGADEAEGKNEGEVEEGPPPDGIWQHLLAKSAPMPAAGPAPSTGE